MRTNVIDWFGKFYVAKVAWARLNALAAGLALEVPVGASGLS